MLSEIVNFHTEGSLKHPLFINTLSSWRQNYQILLKFSYLKSSFTFPNRNSELQCVRALHFITTAGVIIWHIGLGFVITTSYNSKGNSRNIHWKHSSMSTTFEQCSLRMKKKIEILRSRPWWFSYYPQLNFEIPERHFSIL